VEKVALSNEGEERVYSYAGKAAMIAGASSGIDEALNLKEEI